MHKSLLKLVFNTILCASLMLGAATFTACQDYDDDINNLEQKVSALEAAVNDLKTQISNGAVISNVAQNANGVTITLSNGKSYEITNGQDGTPGSVVSIGDNGNWFIDGKDTGKPSQGENGEASASVYYYPETEGENAGLWVKVTEVAGKEPVKEATDDKWLPEGTITAVLSKDVLTLKNVKDAENGEVKLYLTDALGSLVFIPEVYLDGVEADKYEFTMGDYKDAWAVAKDSIPESGDGDYTIKKGTKAFFKPAKNSKGEVVSYFYPSIADMYYHLNPINANIDGATWKFLGATPEFVVRSGEAVVTPTIIGTPVVVEKGEQLKVQYQIPEDMIVGTKDNDYEDHISLPLINKHLSVVALEANFAETKAVVTSDYAALLPAPQELIALSYIEKKQGEHKHLYETAMDAIENPYEVALPYSGGDLNLSELLNVCYFEYPMNLLDELFDGYNDVVDKCTNQMTLEEVAAKYGLTLNFEVVEYTKGNNETEENKYFKLKDAKQGIVTPCYVKNGVPVEIPTGDVNSKEGRSAIGREPVVLVTLGNADGIVLAGYIKLQITETGEAAEVVVNKSNPKVPYICNQVLPITWADMSGEILEELGITKQEFTDDYVLFGNEQSENGNQANPIYVKVDGKFVDVDTFVKDLELDGYDETTEGAYMNEYGFIVENKDIDNAQTNDILTMYLSKESLEHINRDFNGTLTLYVKYNPANGEVTEVNSLYVGIKVSVAAKPVVNSWGLKRDGYWYPKATALADRDTVRTNVPAPDDTNDVKEYSKNIDDYFYHLVAGVEQNGMGFGFDFGENTVSYTDSKGNTISALTTNHKFFFKEETEDLTFVGPNGKTWKLFVHKVAATNDTKDLNGLIVYAAQADTKAANITAMFTEAHDSDNYVACIDNDNTLTYNNSDIAKYFLNLYSHDSDKHQFVVIGATANYDECNIPLTFEKAVSFNARFLRPLDIEANDKAVLADAEGNGASVAVGNLFNLQDWRDRFVVEYKDVADHTGETPVEPDYRYVSVVENGVNLFDYYEIEKVTINLAEATCDLNESGKFMPVNSTIISLSVDGTTDNVVEVSVDSSTDYVDALKDCKLTYKNNKGNTHGFTIKVPVTVTYAWGDVTVEVPVKVTNTLAN